jgi:trimeric autotransporter adhesin
MKYQLKNLLFLLLFLVLFSFPANGQTTLAPRKEFFVTDGPVSVLFATNDTLYVAGEFQNIGFNSGAGLLLHGRKLSLLDHFPHVDGPVYAVVADASGGFYIGGDFTTVGGIPRVRLARIRFDGSVDTSFIPAVTAAPNDTVRALALSGGTLYVGGEFTNIIRAPRNGLAALVPTTGAINQSWNPNVTGGAVRTLAVSGPIVYVGGAFTNVGGLALTNLAAVDANDGAPLPAFNPAPDGPVEALALQSSSLLFVGGSFTNIGGQARSNVAAVHPFSGQITPWNPSVDGPVYSLLIGTGALYVGGEFGTVAEEARANVAALDVSTATLKPWNPSASGRVRTLALTDRGIMVGGLFTNIAGQDRRNLALVDLERGDQVAPLVSPGDEVMALGVSTETIYVGGAFALINAVERNGLAAFNVPSFEPTPLNPSAKPGTNETVAITSLAYGPELIYAARTVSSTSGVRSDIIAFNPALSSTTNFNLAITGEVTAVSLHSNVLYFGGSFTNVGGVGRTNLAAVETTTGGLVDWNPAPNGQVNVLHVHQDRLYVGGSFTILSLSSNVPRRRTGAFELPGRNPSIWSPEPSGTTASTILSIASSSNVIYVGGLFNSIGGQFRTNLAAVDPVTGTATPWNASANNAVWTIAPIGTNICLGGDFTSVNGESRQRIALVTADSGSLVSWNPAASSRVLAFAPAPDGLFVGGVFRGIGPSDLIQGHPHLAYFGVSGRSFLEVSILQGGARLHLNGNAGESYALEQTENLVDWSAFITNRLTNATLTITPPASTNGLGFFRARYRP